MLTSKRLCFIERFPVKSNILRVLFASLHISMRCAQLSAKIGAPKMKIILADVPESLNEDFSLFNIFKYLRSMKRQNEVQVENG